MRQVSYSEARQKLSSLLTAACEDFEEIYISRKNGDTAIMVSAEEYESLKETAYLLSAAANARHLQKSLSNASAENTKKWDDLLNECGINSAI